MAVKAILQVITELVVNFVSAELAFYLDAIIQGVS